LNEGGFDTRNFFYPLGDMDIYKPYVISNAVSRELSGRGISLPTGVDISEAVVKKVADILRTGL
jgi:dTDP-4-amino-4,6-dideoxygalactose transaminase